MESLIVAAWWPLLDFALNSPQWIRLFIDTKSDYDNFAAIGCFNWGMS
jgi:hypothetical protein